jgi:hypothetical protein
MAAWHGAVWSLLPRRSCGRLHCCLHACLVRLVLTHTADLGGRGPPHRRLQRTGAWKMPETRSESAGSLHMDLMFPFSNPVGFFFPQSASEQTSCNHYPHAAFRPCSLILLLSFSKITQVRFVASTSLIRLVASSQAYLRQTEHMRK